MPNVKKKTVPLLPPSVDLVAAVAAAANKGGSDDGDGGDGPAVYYLKATGELFSDYPSYAERFSYLSSKIFQCEATGKTNLSYFAALASEREEARIVRERFPTELKARVLNSVHYQVQGRLDMLVEIVFERYNERYFDGEKVFVDLSGDKYFARISKVFPPQSIRNTAAPSSSLASINPQGFASGSTLDLSSVPTAVLSALTKDDFASVAHRLGIDLSVSAPDARSKDPPGEYLYTVQLMDEDHKFEGSYMEVKGRALSRDRLSFSKSILKRYIRECVVRDLGIGSPWKVKPALAELFSISTARAEVFEQKRAKLQEEKDAKRKKPAKEESENHPAKRHKQEAGDAALKQPKVLKEKKEKKEKEKKEKKEKEPKMKKQRSPVPKLAGPAPAPAAPRPHIPPAKAIKYPIDDLKIDPMTIHDGRILRRVNSELPPLPEKPVPNRVLCVEKDLWNNFLLIWNMLNIFSTPLSLTTFTLDDLASSLNHSAITPRCSLISEIHASLTNVISTDTSRVLGSTTAAPLPVHLADANGGGESSSSSEPETELVEKKSSRRKGRGKKVSILEADFEDVSAVVELSEATEDVDATMIEAGENDDNGESSEEEEELDRLVRKGLRYSKKWDREGKLKRGDGRAGWERHMIGALCQRGGPIAMNNLTLILAHLFEGGISSDKKSTVATSSSALSSAATSTTSAQPVIITAEDRLASSNGLLLDTPSAPQASPSIDLISSDQSPVLKTKRRSKPVEVITKRLDTDPVKRYLLLPLAWKIEIIEYLCTLALGSKVVRAYIEESESLLTDGRKHRADVNKERRKILEAKAALEAATNKPSAKPASASAEPTASTSTGMNGTAVANSNGNQNGSNTHIASDSRAQSMDIDGPLLIDQHPIIVNTASSSTSIARAASLRSDGHEDEGQLAEYNEDDDHLREDSDHDGPMGGTSGPAMSSKAASKPSFSSSRFSHPSKSRQTSVDSDRTTTSNTEIYSLQPSARQLALQAQRDEVTRTKSAMTERHQAESARQALDEDLDNNLKYDNHVEREFRRNSGISRCRPLGKDRFFNRYWWFDGIGGMSLVSKDGARYGTGRLFIQGPSDEDITIARDTLATATAMAAAEQAAEAEALTRAELGAAGGTPIKDGPPVEQVLAVEHDPELKEISLANKRILEEGKAGAILETDEWAFYETEEDIDLLLNWLNNKGVRELALKNAILKWKVYILAGFRRRLEPPKPSATPPPPPHVIPVETTHRKKRVQRGKAETPLIKADDGRPLYLQYVNKLSKI